MRAAEQEHCGTPATAAFDASAFDASVTGLQVLGVWTSAPGLRRPRRALARARSPTCVTHRRLSHTGGAMRTPHGLTVASSFLSLFLGLGAPAAWAQDDDNQPNFLALPRSGPP